ncbi:MAG: DUF2341 domain-containing protein, partial [Promethearchaeota archaeon]
MLDKKGKKCKNDEYLDGKNPLPSLNHPDNANDYKYYKEITINHTKISGAANLVDFQVLISIFDSDLHDKAHSDGEDIAFAINFDWLDHEIELFNQNYNSTHAQLVAWVRVPILSPSVDTVIRMYYGNPYIDSRENPKGVWNDNYLGVWHLSELSGNAKDSTSYGVDGIPSGGLSQGVSGKIGTSYLFSRDTVGTVNMGDPADGHLDFGDGDDFSISFWIDLDYFYYYSAFIVSKRSGGASSSQGYSVQMNDDNLGIPFYEISSNGPEYRVDGTNGCLDQGWKYVVVTWDEDNNAGCKIYLDGSDETSGRTGTIGNIDDISNNQNFRLNGRSSPSTSYTFDGKLDEVRISNVAKSADWIKTEYNNQFNPSSFCNIGSEVEVFIPSINDFEYFKEITIDHTMVSGSTNLINFPLLISIFDSDLHDYVQPDGDDIAFTNGTSWLFHEIELFNQNYNSTHAQLVTWVSVPVLSPSVDTSIYMYYGNSTMSSQQTPTRVWDSNYIGVWHLNENSGNALDSTSFGVNGILSGGVTQGISGQLGTAYNFDGINGYADFGNPIDDHLDFGTGSFTISMWLKIDASTGTWQVPLTKGHPSNLDSGYRFETNQNGQFVYFQISDGSSYVSSNNQDVTFGTWIYLVGRVERSSDEIHLFKDGSYSGYNDISGIGNVDSVENLTISRGLHLSAPVDGSFDEIRISNIAHSDGWIATEYNNQYDPNSFYSIGNAIKVDENAPSDASYFNHYKVITIDSLLVYGSGYHSNFPLLISIYDQDLHS